MKTIRITLKKGEARAVCEHTYRLDDWPLETKWKGDRTPFQVNGKPLTLMMGMDWLEETVAHQAALCGATYEIEDLGGETEFWHM